MIEILCIIKFNGRIKFAKIDERKMALKCSTKAEVYKVLVI